MPTHARAAVLLALLALCSVAPFSISHTAAQTVAPEPQVDSPVQVWQDAGGDLWVRTPRYTWNVTGGAELSATAAAPGYEWRLADNAQPRFIDGLFLAPDPADPLTGRIVFALPDEAVVYVQRAGPSSKEGLALAFRAADGLIRVTHRWIDGPPPVTMALTALTLAPNAGGPLADVTGVLPALPTARAPAEFDYRVSYDPASGAGLARLTPRAIKAVVAAEPQECGASQVGEAPASTVERPPSAHDPCRFPGFFLPGRQISSEYLLLFRGASDVALQALSAELQLAVPDLDVANIERLPRYDYDALQNLPLPGEQITFRARVANRGGQPSPGFAYTWKLDGAVVATATAPGLAPGAETTLSYPWTWQTSGLHNIRLDVDTDNRVAEVSEQNNYVQDRVNGLAIGLWVEQSVYDWFNLHQVELGLGSVSWDDWAQRQVRVWNKMMAEAITSLTPVGILERVRLDKVTIVPDGALPSCATNGPAPGDKTIDLQWGFPAEEVGIPAGHSCGAFNYYLDHPEATDVEYSLMHELSHARYLVDLYGMNVYVSHAALASGVDAAQNRLPVTRNVETDGNFATPVDLAVAAGELVRCQGKVGSEFRDCSRGSDGTRAQAYPAGQILNLAAVRIQDAEHDLVQGSSELPLVGFQDHLYYNRHGLDLMSGGTEYYAHSAYALNRIAGKRPVCGNYNAPCNIGEYLNDLPQNHVVEIRDANDLPLEGAQVDVYRGRPLAVWYGKSYAASPDATFTTNALGRANLGAALFGAENIVHTYGHSNAVPLLRITARGAVRFRFLEVTQANEAYWTGSRDEATYVINTDIDNQARTWTATTSLPTALATPFEQAGKQMVAYGGRLYLFGGENASDERRRDVYVTTLEGNGSLGAWTRTTALPGGFYDQSVVRVGSRVYLLTGAGGSTAVYVAALNGDGSLGAWSSATSLPESRQGFAAAAVGNFIYAAGGNAMGPRAFVQYSQVRADGSLGAWTNTTALPAPMEGHVMVTSGQTLYVLSPAGSVFYAQTAVDGALGPWQSTSVIPTALTGYSAFAHAGKLYVLGGYSTTVYESTIAPSGALGPWTATSTLPEPRRGAWVAAENGYGYAVGGISTGGYTAAAASRELQSSSCGPITSTPYFTSYYGGALLNGVDASTGAIVEAFSPRGDRVGCFKVTSPGMYGYMRVYGEDPYANPPTPGMRHNEQVTFKINNVRAGASNCPVLWQDDKLLRDLNLAAPAACASEQVVALHEGLNWFSFSRETAQTDPASVLSSVEGGYTSVLGEDGAYAPPPADPRFNTLTSLVPGKGYMIRVKAPATLSVIGEQAPINTMMILQKGLRWIGYLPRGPIDIPSALGSIAGKYDLLLSEWGAYAPPPADPRFNTLLTMEPGRAYLVRMTQNYMLAYPPPAEVAPPIDPAAGQGAPDAPAACQAVPTPFFTQFYGTLTIAGQPAPKGATIVAFSPRGDEVGCFQVTSTGVYGYMRVYGEDKTVSPAIPGMRAGEQVTFRVAGQTAAAAGATTWQDDKGTHPVSLSTASAGRRVYVPLLMR